MNLTIPNAFRHLLAGLFLLALMAATARAQAPGTNAAPAAVIDVWPEGKVPGQAAKDSEREVPARR